MIPDGWNRQREASNNHQDSSSVEGPTNKPSSQRYLQLFSLVLSWKGLGISLLATIFGVIALRLYFISLSFLCLKQPKVWFLLLLQQTGTSRERQEQTGT